MSERPPSKTEQSSPINSFMGTFSKNVSRPNLFSVRITPPIFTFGADGEKYLKPIEYNRGLYSTNVAGPELELRVQSVTMPGKNITTTPNENTYGPSYEMANGISYAEELSVTYILDTDHRVREFFNKWQDRIVDPASYDLSYYKDYIGEMDISQLDQNDNTASAIRVHEVFPKSVGPIEYSMESGNSFLTVTVQMAFKNWTPLGFNYQGTKSATWIDAGLNGNAQSETGLRFSETDPLYRLQNLFGIGIPPEGQQIINTMNSVRNFTSNPLQFLTGGLSNAIRDFS